MSRPAKHFTGAIFGFPRVSGDEPTAKRTLAAIKAFSPRERG